MAEIDKTALQAADYTEDNIQVLEMREQIRLRPGMWVGGTDSRALHHLIYEVVDNSIDEALAGRCDHITVTLHPDNVVSVEDNGARDSSRHAQESRHFHIRGRDDPPRCGAKFDSGAYKVSGGLHGVGVSAVNILSENLTAQVARQGVLYEQNYKEGIPQGDVEKIGEMQPGQHTGTRITFRPDFSIMMKNDFNYNTLAQRFREMAFVTRKVTITLRDERVEPFPQEITYYFEGGLKSFVKYLNRHRTEVHEPVYAEREIEIEGEKETFDVGVEVAFQYTDAATVTELAFANTINTKDGGSHLTGLRSAITGTINRFARKNGYLKEKEANFSGNDTMEGLTAVVSIKHPDPQFESQTKVKLMNPEMQGAVSQVVSEALNEFLEVNSREARKIIDKCMTSKRAREAARKARDLVRSGPSLLESSTLPGKLADCSRHDEGAELYIVEGDSAGGTAKQGRDRHFQAILPLRGKILNTERARLNKILDNNEVKAMITALGTGVGDDFDVDSLRYGRVIIMTDADVDGSHIRTLLLTFFFRHMQPLITGGHLYIAQPPIFQLSYGKQIEYVFGLAGNTEQQLLNKKLKRFKSPERVKVQRYKGLGEMNATQLWETTMDPEARTLLQVTIEDAAEADRIFDMLMGSSVPPRRKFIQSHAKSVRNLDV